MGKYHLLFDTKLKCGIRTTSDEAKDDILQKANCVFLTTVSGKNLSFTNVADIDLLAKPERKMFRFVTYREYISHLFKINKGEINEN